MIVREPPGAAWTLTFGNDSIPGKAVGKLDALGRLDPRVVVEATLDVDAIFNTMEPDILAQRLVEVPNGCTRT